MENAAVVISNTNNLLWKCLVYHFNQVLHNNL